MTIKSTKVDSKTTRFTCRGETYLIKKETKWTWKTYDYQGILVKGMTGPSPVKVEAKLEAWIEERYAVPLETPQEFKDRGGKVLVCKPQPNGRVKPEGPRTAEKNRKYLDLNNKPKKIRRKKKDPSKETPPKPNRIRTQEHLTTLQDLLEELGLTGTKARKILRASGVEKPGKQWVWENKSKDLRKAQEALNLATGITKAIGETV